MEILNKALYAIAYSLWYLLSLLPFRALYVLSDIIYFFVAKVFRYRHKVITRNLSSSFPEKSSDELKHIETEFYHWFCDYLVETVKLMTISSDELKKRMTFSGMEEFNKALNEGQSCAMYLGHYCNWEWITSLPHWVPSHVQCTELYHPLENKVMDTLFKSVRERQNALCIPMQESLREILRYKNDNKAIVVGYIADQVPHWKNIHHWLTFLNHDTPVLTGSERIVRKTNQAAFYGDMTRPRRGYYHCEVKLITLTPKSTSDFAITDAYFRMLEETIRRTPQYWLWSHNRWKRTREEFNERFEVKDGKVIERKHNENNPQQ